MTNAIKLGKTVLSLPNHPWLEDWEITKIIDTVRSFYKGRG